MRTEDAFGLIFFFTAAFVWLVFLSIKVQRLEDRAATMEARQALVEERR